MKIAIIGSAGRRSDAAWVNATSFQWMLDDFEQLVRDLGVEWRDVQLLSGGAAFADHVAVVKALEHNAALKLFLPCAWDTASRRYADTGQRDWRSNPGGTSNFYHEQFSLKCGQGSRGTLEQLHQALQRDFTESVVEEGFFARNNGLAAEADLLIAYAFGEGPEPSSGGTLRTWQACTSKKIKRTIQK